MFASEVFGFRFNKDRWSFSDEVNFAYTTNRETYIENSIFAR